MQKTSKQYARIHTTGLLKDRHFFKANNCREVLVFFKRLCCKKCVCPDQTDCLYAEIIPKSWHLHAADNFSRRHFHMFFCSMWRTGAEDEMKIYSQTGLTREVPSLLELTGTPIIFYKTKNQVPVSVKSYSILNGQ